MSVEFNPVKFDHSFGRYREIISQNRERISQKPSFCSRFRPFALISNVGFAIASWMRNNAGIKLDSHLGFIARLKALWEDPIKLEIIVQEIIRSENENEIISLFVSPIERGHSVFGLCIIESIKRPEYLGILRHLADANPALFKAALTKNHFDYIIDPRSEMTPLYYEYHNNYWSNRNQIDKLPVFHMLATHHREILTKVNGDFDGRIVGSRGYYGAEHKDLFDRFVHVHPKPN